MPSCEKAPYHIGYWLEIEEKLTNLQKSPSVDLLVEVILEFINLAKFDHSKYFASSAPADEKSDLHDLKDLQNFQFFLSNVSFDCIKEKTKLL